MLCMFVCLDKIYSDENRRFLAQIAELAALKMKAEHVTKNVHPSNYWARQIPDKKLTLSIFAWRN